MYREADRLIPVTDAHELQLLLERSDAEVSPRPNNEFALTRRSGRIAIPVRGSSHFNLQDIDRVALAFRERGAERLFAVSLERQIDIETAYGLGCAAVDVKAFNWKCAHFNYVLETEDASAMIICSVEDFFVVVGDESFVSSAVGGSVEGALRDFEVYAVDSGIRPPGGGYLSDLVVRLRDEYPTLAEGTVMTLPRAHP
jgi:hypothetical protein